MQIGACVLAYREESVIGECLKGLAPIDDILVLISLTSWTGRKDPMDMTEEVVGRAEKDSFCGNWKDEAEQRNFGLNYMSDCDWVWMVDADEHFDPVTVERVNKMLPDVQEDALIVSHDIYWKDETWKLDLAHDVAPITVCKPSVKFKWARLAECRIKHLPQDIRCKHLSYARSDKDMEIKLKNFSHSHELVPGWYENVWKGWKPEMQNLHPVNPPEYRRAVKVV